MNNVLELKTRFEQESKYSSGGGGPRMNGSSIVTSEHLIHLEKRIKKIKDFWLHEKKPFKGILLTVFYNKIVAKSNRISGLLKGENSKKAIVGSKFNKDKNKHIITYFLDISDLDKSLILLNETNFVLKEIFQGKIDQKSFDNKKKMDSIPFYKFDICKSNFKQVIADVSYIDTFDIDKTEGEITESIITLYDTKTDTKELLKNLGIDILSNRILENQTILLDKNQTEILFEKAPYLVSMAVKDLSQLSNQDFFKENQEILLKIPNPTIEPTIGVIDTLFDNNVYFSNWIEYYDMVDNNIKEEKDYEHGTAISSIIVDGPTLNPWLDDQCGRFKVRHFGIAKNSNFSSFNLIRKIKEIIASNKDIKVWNISLGSNQEINDNFISAEASVLDQIQYENDVIFVIAGGNKPHEGVNKIGSPADSINSMVVNSVTKNGLIPEYARKGIVLSFFAKPDVSYYGGSKEKYINVYGTQGKKAVSGTSFAAPWIARKLSYLIDVLELNRETAKAMILHSAKGWNNQNSENEIALFGHGIVPIKIEDIIKTKNDEIRFVVSDTSEKYNTYNYKFPVPMKDDKYPYIVKATMCYFPKCNRLQGVDYTNTELNLHFGRIQDDGKLKTINNDKQNQILNENREEKNNLLEKEVRNNFRKWDNVKHIIEKLKNKNQPRKSYKKNKNWGMEIKTNNRIDSKDGENIRFAVVVTLKEIYGINRINEFIRSCYLNGILVNELNIKNKINIYQKINEEVKFNDE